MRPERFVTQKIIRSVQRIAKGSNEKLELGRLDIARDWGWAPEYVEAMWLMLQQASASDYVIATGITQTLESFVSLAFMKYGLDWKEHVKMNKELLRPTDLMVSRADPSKAKNKLGWNAVSEMKDVIDGMFMDI